MHATWPAVGPYDKILVQSSQYLMDAAHDFRKRLKAYTATGKGKVCTVKPVLSGHLKKDKKLGFQTDYRLMQVKSIAECSSILQYFRLSLSYHLTLRSLFCLFWSGCLRQVLL